ncbi:helix-turn-helix transcriptional regulator [Bacillus mycoides]
MGVSRNTISRLCNNKSHTPSFPVIQKIFWAIKKLTGVPK